MTTVEPGARLTPRRREIVEAARQILERDGESALTMRRLAADLGMKAPSLYKHFPDKESLELELIIVGFEESAAAFEAALATQPRSQIEALGAAYREYARAHPHIYRLMTDRPLPRERLPVGLEYRAAAPLDAGDGFRRRRSGRVGPGPRPGHPGDQRPIPGRRRHRCRMAGRYHRVGTSAPNVT